MDYSKAASEFIDRMFRLVHTPMQRKLNDFPKGEIFILNYLTDRQQPATPSELSEAMQASTARIAAALNSLESKGEIVRQDDRVDRRRTLVVLTPQGRQRVLEQRRAMHRHVEKILRSLGEEDTAHLIRLLDRIRNFQGEDDFLPPCM